ncbi:MAG: hypothetical protein D6B25_03305 [Desulfobulbaceae bacterium]|nr:MAG: hypothetical protein D6B25_03305 [Desulfobulbaceae bacterium]
MVQEKAGCQTCKWRMIHDEKPRSILGRLWRFHINFCPGWKKYMNDCAPEERLALVKKYNLKPPRA